MKRAGDGRESHGAHKDRNIFIQTVKYKKIVVLKVTYLGIHQDT